MKAGDVVLLIVAGVAVYVVVRSLKPGAVSSAPRFYPAAAPAGSPGAAALFSAIAAAQDAFRAVVATPPGVAAAVAGPPAGSFAGVPMFGPEAAAQDVQAAFNFTPGQGYGFPPLPAGGLDYTHALAFGGLE